MVSPEMAWERVLAHLAPLPDGRGHLAAGAPREEGMASPEMAWERVLAHLAPLPDGRGHLAAGAREKRA